MARSTTGSRGTTLAVHQFWETVLAPALTAAAVKRVVEIGALRGETTLRLLDLLGPDSELHVIDPVPIFDPSEHARHFAGSYRFHHGISLDVLPTLPPFDAALIDGDHNWFTVYHELRLLAAAASRADAPLPLLVLHDVCWPYGRRDLYYEPERIPAEARQPFDARGMVPGEEMLAARGGLNPHLHNALREGGARNGVMTALEDFAREHPEPLRIVVLPLYHGLALAADERLLARCPELAAQLDSLESAEGRGRLLELAESVRLSEQAEHHTVQFGARTREHRAALRYLALLSAVLEHGEPQRLMALQEALDALREREVAGHIVDCAGAEPHAAIFARGYLEAYDLRGRTVWLASSLEDGVSAGDAFARVGLLDDAVRIVHGDVVAALAREEVDKIALLRVEASDETVAGATVSALSAMVAHGGVIVVEHENGTVWHRHQEQIAAS